jgi:hypothetical protein
MNKIGHLVAQMSSRLYFAKRPALLKSMLP